MVEVPWVRWTIHRKCYSYPLLFISDVLPLHPVGGSAVFGVNRSQIPAVSGTRDYARSFTRWSLLMVLCDEARSGDPAVIAGLAPDVRRVSRRRRSSPVGTRGRHARLRSALAFAHAPTETGILAVLTIFFGLASAIGWGAPDPVLAQAVRRIGAFPVVFGSIVIGTRWPPRSRSCSTHREWTERSLLLAPLVGHPHRGRLPGRVHVVPRGRRLGRRADHRLRGRRRRGAFAAGRRAGRRPRPARPAAGGRRCRARLARRRGEQQRRRRSRPRSRRSSGAACSRCRRRSPTTSAPAGPSCSSAAAPSRSCCRWHSLTARRAPRCAEWWRVAIWGVCDAAAYFAFVLAADHGPTSVAGVLAAQFGTVGAIVAVVFFGEHLRRRQVAGIAIVALAVGAMAVGGG